MQFQLHADVEPQRTPAGIATGAVVVHASAQERQGRFAHIPLVAAAGAGEVAADLELVADAAGEVTSVSDDEGAEDVHRRVAQVSTHIDQSARSPIDLACHAAMFQADGLDSPPCSFVKLPIQDRELPEPAREESMVSVPAFKKASGALERRWTSAI
jgi:hypothetical protein